VEGSLDLQTVAEREARRRGIEFSIEPRPHSRQDPDELAHRIYGGADRLRELGFEIAGISAVREEPGPIVVEGQLAAGRRSPAQLSLVEDLASERSYQGCEARPTRSRNTSDRDGAWRRCELLSGK